MDQYYDDYEREQEINRLRGGDYSNQYSYNQQPESNSQPVEYTPPNGNTGVSGYGGSTTAQPPPASQQVSPMQYSGGDAKDWIMSLFGGGPTSEQKLRELAPTINSAFGADSVQIASDGTARGRLHNIPGYGMVTVIGDQQTWGDGPWAWRTGNEQFGSGGGGGAPAAAAPAAAPYVPYTPPTTQAPGEASLPPATPAAPVRNPEDIEAERVLREMLMKMAQQGTTVDQNAPEYRQQVDSFTAQQDRARRQYESESAERLSAEGLGDSGAMENERRFGMERAGQQSGMFESQLIAQELQSRRDEIRFALEGLGGMISEEQTRNLERELKQIDVALAQEMSDLEARLKREQLGEQSRQFGASLGQQDRQFGIDAGIRIGENEARYDPRYR